MGKPGFYLLGGETDSPKKVLDCQVLTNGWILKTSLGKTNSQAVRRTIRFEPDFRKRLSPVR
ncbi:MAG TPA: hypothetical protein PLN21_18910 [Gemmatales bacterium]|nr:hypothetical protein [Gemmatales bacterium]